MTNYLRCKVIRKDYEDGKLVYTGYIDAKVIHMDKDYVTVAFMENGRIAAIPNEMIIMTDPRVMDSIIDPRI